MSEWTIALIGVGIALVGVIIGALLKHLLTLRADRINRETDRDEKEAEKRRQATLSEDPIREYQALRSPGVDLPYSSLDAADVAYTLENIATREQDEEGEDTQNQRE